MADTTEKLKDLMVMLDRGLITREEFDQQKTALLSGGSAPPSGRPSTIGSYRITGEIGHGGMGRVYRGRHRTAEFADRHGGDVAIKVLHAQYAERADIIERFEREAALGIKLDHPGIVKVHELVVDAGRVALVMELIEGRPLSQMIGQETGPIPWARAQPMFEAMLDAVAYAHDHGVVHRDLKPENVMVRPGGRLKVLDFGIAKDMSTGRTKTGTGMGTIDYMAPEQYIDAKAVDARADIYALGMTLYEMVAGRLPWGDDASEFEILKRKEQGNLPAPTEFYPDIPPHVVVAVAKATETRIPDRFASTQQFAAALSQVAAQTPAAAPVPARSGTVLETEPPELTDDDPTEPPGTLTSPPRAAPAVQPDPAPNPEPVVRESEEDGSTAVEPPGTVHCFSCGNPSERGKSWCHACGGPLPLSTLCPCCGKTLPNSQASWCTQCGVRTRSAQGHPWTRPA